MVAAYNKALEAGALQSTAERAAAAVAYTIDPGYREYIMYDKKWKLERRAAAAKLEALAMKARRLVKKARKLVSCLPAAASATTAEEAADFIFCIGLRKPTCTSTVRRSEQCAGCSGRGPADDTPIGGQFKCPTCDVTFTRKYAYEVGSGKSSIGRNPSQIGRNPSQLKIFDFTPEMEQLIWAIDFAPTVCFKKKDLGHMDPRCVTPS